MKTKKILYIGCVLMGASLCSCEDFLTKEPLDTHVNDTYWQSELSLRTYAQDFYSSFFKGYGTDYTVFGGYYSGDNYTDDFLSNINADTYSGAFLYFPSSSITGYNGVTSTWTNDYSVIYKANVMIEKIPDMPISDEAKNHWMGIARYFRAMAYSDLLKIYGGVPYIDRPLAPTGDEETLYKDRDPYLYVAQQVLEDYEYAVANVRKDDTRQQVNRYVVGAYMSRDLLFHATWLKYHGTNIGPSSEAVADEDIRALLQGAIDGAEVVMNSRIYRIGNTYNALFTTDDLYNNPEIIWYREYASGVQCNALMSYNCNEEERGGITQSAIESYLCSDGLPIGQSPLYEGADDPSIQNAFQNRDPRLYQTVADSIRLVAVQGISFSSSRSTTGYACKKFLNDEWYASGSSYCNNINSPADAPCIRYAEVLLNYVEARYEISRVGGLPFTQDDLDKSINALRNRQLTKYGEVPQVTRTMPHVTLSGSNLSVDGVVINDPVRDPEVDPILWEIRRERRVELLLEGRRGDDLRRWAKYEYLNSEDASGNPTKVFLGVYIKLSDYPKMAISGEDEESGEFTRYASLYNPNDPTNADAQEGYVEPMFTQNDIRIFQKGDLNSERYYLRAIPSSQITVYSDKGYKLTQNPGW